MSSIRITKTPDGQAPDWVRAAWVGLEIPIIAEESLVPATGKTVGVLGGKPSKRNLGGYAVSVEMALAALRQKSAHAAQWFEDHLQPGMSTFIFGEEFCEYLP